MTRLIRVELLKIRTTRLACGLLLTAVGLTTLFSIIEAALSGPGKSVAPLSTAAGLNSVITGGTWALLLAAVMRATVSSGEFRHSTATLTYLAAPARDKVLMAKVTAGTIAGAVFGLVGYLIAAAVGLIFVTAHGYHLAVGDATLIRYGLGHILAGALMAAIGVALGSLIRSQLAVVIGVLVWSIVVESLVGGLIKSAQPYLPYTAATTLAGSQLGGAAFGPAHGVVNSAIPLPFAAAAALAQDQHAAARRLPERSAWPCSCATSSGRCGAPYLQAALVPAAPVRALIAPVAWLTRRLGLDARYRRCASLACASLMRPGGAGS